MKETLKNDNSKQFNHKHGWALRKYNKTDFSIKSGVWFKK